CARRGAMGGYNYGFYFDYW
nr:immunoglobulin heavy chain junction region [Macaca mulatta]MOV36799.1 immunoglobulin heavy chain junction region [Macaca mulatta]